jgi:signal transduction histidine kinase
LPVEVRAGLDEVAVYHVVSEALANAAKHSRASEVSATVNSGEASVRATITDDGCGGAVLGGSSGLTGLLARVEALGGRFSLDSPAGRGTTICPLMPRPPTSVRTFELSPGPGSG